MTLSRGWHIRVSFVRFLVEEKGLQEEESMPFTRGFASSTGGSAEENTDRAGRGRGAAGWGSPWRTQQEKEGRKSSKDDLFPWTACFSLPSTRASPRRSAKANSREAVKTALRNLGSGVNICNS